MEQNKKILGYYNYTVVLTYIGMIMGFMGLLFVMSHKFQGAVICLMIAGLCDMFDGAVAATRKRNEHEKKFGIQIDSLSDLICFGILPSIFVAQIENSNYISFAIAICYVLCALIRLAYFNVHEEERQKLESTVRKYYQGLPVTTIALFLPAVYILFKRRYAFTCLLFIMAILFLSPIKIKKPEMLGKVMMAALGVLEFIVLIVRI
ncbi:MAG: CDP-alcohol phosphatidyltransferase family protein [Ruminococcus sp.]|nr:CDP-alcohol phosphatidyltransferase family protein [Ruminococcus sp.]